MWYRPNTINILSDAHGTSLCVYILLSVTVAIVSRPVANKQIKHQLYCGGDYGEVQAYSHALSTKLLSYLIPIASYYVIYNSVILS